MAESVELFAMATRNYSSVLVINYYGMKLSSYSLLFYANIMFSIWFHIWSHWRTDMRNTAHISINSQVVYIGSTITQIVSKRLSDDMIFGMRLIAKWIIINIFLPHHLHCQMFELH